MCNQSTTMLQKQQTALMLNHWMLPSTTQKHYPSAHEEEEVRSYDDDQPDVTETSSSSSSDDSNSLRSQLLSNCDEHHHDLDDDDSTTTTTTTASPFESDLWHVRLDRKQTSLCLSKFLMRASPEDWMALHQVLGGGARRRPWTLIQLSETVLVSDMEDYQQYKAIKERFWQYFAPLLVGVPFRLNVTLVLDMNHNKYSSMIDLLAQIEHDQDITGLDIATTMTTSSKDLSDALIDLLCYDERNWQSVVLRTTTTTTTTNDDFTKLMQDLAREYKLPIQVFSATPL